MRALFGFLCGSLILSATAWSVTPRHWDPYASTSSLMRAGAGVTHPIFYSMPEWNRAVLVDADWVSENPAFLGFLDNSSTKFSPVGIQAYSNGFSLFDSYKSTGESVADLRSQLAEGSDSAQRSVTNIALNYYMKNFAYTVMYARQKNLWIESGDQGLYYQFFKDVVIQFASGGKIFDTKDFGRLDFGSAVRLSFRSGAERSIGVSEIVSSSTFPESDFDEKALAIGLDYSLLWTNAGFNKAGWGFQIGVVGKNIGTTRFFNAEQLFELLGTAEPVTRRFPAFPNNTTVGLGLKLPNFREGLRSALRVEWTDWTRDMSLGKKTTVAYEMRFPGLLSLNAGIRGTHPAVGASLRFRGIRLDLGTFVDFWGNGESLQANRSYLFELKGEF